MLAWSHRQTPVADIYFIANTDQAPVDALCAFRVDDGVPELWRPDTAERVTAAVYYTLQGQTFTPIHLEKGESVFVVFRRGSAPTIHLEAFKDLTQTNGGAKVMITRATWASSDGSWSLDVTGQLQQCMDKKDYRVKAANETFGGSAAPGISSELRVDYSVDGVASTMVVPQGGVFQPAGVIPESSLPHYELKPTSAGGIELDAWNAGLYEITTLDGVAETGAVASIPDPIELDGPWTVAFPSGLGAPSHIRMPRLNSLTESDDPGVRYFSGTCTYDTDFPLDAGAIDTHSDLFLDLGAVENIAEVTLNGKPLGILWKPPYIIRVTDILKPGVNRLSVAVTNVWVNRLIGDEQTPGNADYRPQPNGGQIITAWPSWVLSGKKRPPGRIAFSSIRDYAKDSALQPSGLIGPVLLRTVKKVEIKVP
jgi:hypothetical protein